MLQNERLRELIATHSLPIKEPSMKEASRKIARRLIAVPLSRPVFVDSSRCPIWPSWLSVLSEARILQPKVGIITSGQRGIHSSGGYSPAIHRRSPSVLEGAILLTCPFLPSPVSLSLSPVPTAAACAPWLYCIAKWHWSPGRRISL